jgi:hypothetical protein
VTTIILASCYALVTTVSKVRYLTIAYTAIRPWWANTTVAATVKDAILALRPGAAAGPAQPDVVTHVHRRPTPDPVGAHGQTQTQGGGYRPEQLQTDLEWLAERSSVRRVYFVAVIAWRQYMRLANLSLN